MNGVFAPGPAGTGPGPTAGGTATTTGIPASVPPMLVVRLKLALLRNGLRQSGGRLAAYIGSLVVVLLGAGFLLLGLIVLRGNAHAGTVVALLVSLAALGWAVAPLFFASGDETLDPTRLVMLPLRPRPLVRALLLSSLVGIGPLFTLCLVAGSVYALAHGTGALLTGVAGALLALLVCVALARAVAAANVRLLTSRRGRDLAVLSGLVVAVGLQFVNFGAQRLGAAGGLGPLDPAGTVLSWVPPASALGAADAASAGEWGGAFARLALSLLALLLLLAHWQRSLTHLMTTPDTSTVAAAAPGRRAGRSPGRTRRRLLPDGRTGAVMERALRYVWRDPKTKAAWVTSLAIGLIVPVFNALQDSGSLYFACFAAGLLGIQMFNQFGQDGSAFWMVAQTLSTPRDAYGELRARTLALLLVTLPYAVLVTVLTAALLSDWQALPEALGLSFALLGSLLAAGAWASARFPYAIPRDGYKNVAPGQAGLAWLSLVGGMGGATLLSVPVLGLTLWLHLAGAHDWLWLVLPVGALYGAAIAYAGLRLAARVTARRLPEILAAVSA